MKERIAPCGLDCGTCPAQETNISAGLRARFAELFHCRPEEAACSGCRLSGGSPVTCPDCPTFACAAEHGVRYCFECPEFPCRMLMPVADGAARFPHNTKLYNLCRIRLLGSETWLKEIESDMDLYFAGKLVLGRGPTPSEEGDS